MIVGDLAPVVAAVCVLLVVFCLGGMAGVYMAWSMEARFERWARRVAAVQRAYNEVEARADGVATAGAGARGRDLGSETPEEHALRAERGSSDVLALAGAAMVDTGPGSPAVNGWTVPR